MREIDFDGLRQMLTSDTPPTLVDCRAAEYWHWETIAGSRNLRWKEAEQRAARVIPDRAAPIVTFCQSVLCDASHRAYATLIELGYSNLWEYSGGVEEWRLKGGELQRSPLRISERSLRLPGQKFYGEDVGSYVIDADDAVIVVDGPQFLSDANEDFLLSFNKPIKIFLTHGATGGVASILERSQGAQIFLNARDRDNEWLTCEPTNLFDHEFELASGLRVINTPGHTPGSACLYDERERVLYSGDHLQGCSSSEVWDFIAADEQRGDPNLQLESVAKLLTYEIRSVQPFHYTPITENPTEAIHRYLAKHKYTYKGEIA
jgi:glyoxylase-like metal-dependent hydrolase (beta-lactamase superfamily II)